MIIICNAQKVAVAMYVAMYVAMELEETDNCIQIFTSVRIPFFIKSISMIGPPLVLFGCVI